jgi:hypothetical protein
MSPAVLAAYLLPWIAVVNPDDPDACWDWQGKRQKYGYGCISRGHQGAILAHRAMWQVLTGHDIEKGMCICHTCDRPSCVRPSHLFLGTHADNVRDKVNKGRQHRPRGERHPKARLTAGDVIAIRASNAQHLQLAKAYGITATSIRYIRARKNWKHVA